MIDTLEQFEQAEEAIAKMKQFLLVVQYTYTPEAYRALSAPILRELRDEHDTAGEELERVAYHYME
jgi:hypothetical protein